MGNKAADALRIGQKVSVTRINGEKVQGVISKGPLDYMKHIGEFYIIRWPAPAFIGKDMPREIGMYGRERIRTESSK